MKTDSIKSLKIRITELESTRDIQFTELNAQFQEIVDELKPMNILKKAFQNVMELPKMKDGIGNFAIGSLTGVLAKKALWGNSINPLRMLLGFITQSVVTNVTTKNADAIREKGEDLIQPLLKQLFHYRKMKREEKLLEEEVY